MQVPHYEAECKIIPWSWEQDRDANGWLLEGVGYMAYFVVGRQVIRPNLPGI